MKTIHHVIDIDAPAATTYNFNWGYYMESLRLLCTTGAGKPFVPVTEE
jgi:hypothetical protein